MLKPFSLIFFVLVMAWLGAIFIPSDPRERMDRACVPVEYVDKAGTAGMQLIDAGWGIATHQFFQNIHYGCRFVVWRMFYEDDWNRARQQSRAQAVAENERRPGSVATGKGTQGRPASSP